MLLSRWKSWRTAGSWSEKGQCRKTVLPIDQNGRIGLSQRSKSRDEKTTPTANRLVLHFMWKTGYCPAWLGHTEEHHARSRQQGRATPCAHRLPRAKSRNWMAGLRTESLPSVSNGAAANLRGSLVIKGGTIVSVRDWSRPSVRHSPGSTRSIASTVRADDGSCSKRSCHCCLFMCLEHHRYSLRRFRAVRSPSEARDNVSHFPFTDTHVCILAQ